MTLTAQAAALILPRCRAPSTHLISFVFWREVLFHQTERDVPALQNLLILLGLSQLNIHLHPLPPQVLERRRRHHATSVTSPRPPRSSLNPLPQVSYTMGAVPAFAPRQLLAMAWRVVWEMGEGEKPLSASQGHGLPGEPATSGLF